MAAELDYFPEELEGLESLLSDTYFCNFSLFQSMPDSWAVKQLFPIMPIHRLGEPPTRHAVLGDISCDSDGKVDQFIDRRDVKKTLRLHGLNGRPYYLGAFLVGAYQEILGDLHNLFGDTNAVHVSIGENGEALLDAVIRGDTVREVLDYVQFNSNMLLEQYRRDVEAALREGRIGYEESGRLLRFYEQGLNGYTYLEDAAEDGGLVLYFEQVCGASVSCGCPWVRLVVTPSRFRHVREPVSGLLSFDRMPVFWPSQSSLSARCAFRYNG